MTGTLHEMGAHGLQGALAEVAAVAQNVSDAYRGLGGWRAECRSVMIEMAIVRALRAIDYPLHTSARQVAVGAFWLLAVTQLLLEEEARDEIPTGEMSEAELRDSRLRAQGFDAVSEEQEAENRMVHELDEQSRWEPSQGLLGLFAEINARAKAEAELEEAERKVLGEP